MNFRKNSKGITLIALVITIIVLLILAAVSLNLVAGTDGILGRAGKAVDETTIASAKERAEMLVAEYGTDFYDAKYVKRNFDDEINDYVITSVGGGKTSGDYFVKIVQEDGKDKVIVYKGTEANDDSEIIRGTLLKNSDIVWDDVDSGNGGNPGGSEGQGGNQTPQPTKYTITYNANGGTENVPASEEYEEGATVTVDFTTVPTKDGFTFKGWATSADATTATYASGGTTSFAVGTSNVTLYAVWEEDILKVGDEVAYTPSGTYDEWTTAHSGYYDESTEKYISYKLASGSSYIGASEQTNMTISNWKVFKIDEATGEVQLVPDGSKVTTPALGLGGVNGYNNSVKLLNDACSALYSNTAKGISARSINMEDIESVLDYEPTTYSDYYATYGQQYSSAYTSYKKYPAIYAEEKDSVITPEPEGKTKTLGLSDSASDWVTGSVTAGTSIQPYQTYYFLGNGNVSAKLNEGYSDVLLPNGSSTQYWVASRCVSLDSSSCQFRVRCVYYGDLNYGSAFGSDYYDNNHERPLFPIVSLSSELIARDATSNWIVE